MSEVLFGSAVSQALSGYGPLKEAGLGGVQLSLPYPIAGRLNSKGYPLNPNQPPCSFYARTGSCRYGTTCKFSHPEDQSVKLNSAGYPLHPEETDCVDYVTSGTCQFGAICKFNHPEGVGKKATSEVAKDSPAPPTVSTGPPTASAGSTSAPEGPQPSTNLYVKGLPADITDASLRQIFGSYGLVTSTRVLDKRTPDNNESSTALIRMTDVEEATWLVQNLSGNIPVGLDKPVTVQFADTSRKSSGQFVAPPPATSFNSAGMPIRPGETRCAFYMRTGTCRFGPTCKFDHPEGVASASAARGSQGTPPSDNLYIKGLPPTMTDDMLKKIFGAYGTVVSTKVMPPRSPEMSEAVACVRMGDIEQATWVVENLNGNIPQGLETPVMVKFADGGAYSVAPNLNSLGFPLRPGVTACSFYLRTGTCKFGATCKNDHPDPGVALAGGAADGGVAATVAALALLAGVVS